MKLTEEDLERMSLTDLKALKKRVDDALHSFEERQRQIVYAKLQEQARSLGFTLEQLVPGAKFPQKKRRSVSEPKFRDPKDPEKTWTGRGRKPAWFEAAMAEGLAPGDMAI